MQTTTSKEFNCQARAPCAFAPLRRRCSSPTVAVRPMYMSYAANQALQGPAHSVADLLAMPAVDELDEVLQTSRDIARSADLS